MRLFLIFFCFFISLYALSVREYLGDEKITELQNAGYSNQQIVSFAKDQREKERAEEEILKQKEYEKIQHKKAIEEKISLLFKILLAIVMGMVLFLYFMFNSKRKNEGKETYGMMLIDKFMKSNKYKLCSYLYALLGVFIVIFPPKFQYKSYESKFGFFINLDKIDFYFFLYEIISYLLVGGIMYFVFYKNKTIVKDSHARD